MWWTFVSNIPVFFDLLEYEGTVTVISGSSVINLIMPKSHSTWHESIVYGPSTCLHSGQRLDFWAEIHPVSWEQYFSLSRCMSNDSELLRFKALTCKGLKYRYLIVALRSWLLYMNYYKLQFETKVLASLIRSASREKFHHQSSLAHSTTISYPTQITQRTPPCSSIAQIESQTKPWCVKTPSDLMKWE